MTALLSLFSRTILSIQSWFGSPDKRRNASVLSSTGLPSMASSSLIILARDAYLMMLSSPLFLRLLSSSISRSSCALSPGAFESVTFHRIRVYSTCDDIMVRVPKMRHARFLED